MIPRSDIDKVKEKADLVDIMNRYGVTLKTSGNAMKGLCPFHDESTPSFNVRPNFGTYKCFGCGESGDVIAFIQHKEGLNFDDAVRMLAEQFGVEIHETGNDADSDGPNKRRLYAAMEEAAKFYQNRYAQLPNDHVARLELRKRNLEKVEGNDAWLETFGIGYAPEGWSHLTDYLVEKGFTIDELQTCGLVGKNKDGRVYDFFRGRLTWEIRDIRGRVVGFGARKLYDTDNGPKYLNSGETPIYHKSSTLYGMDLARKAIYDAKCVYIVEGYTDVMAMHAAGISNVVASSGTAFGDVHAGVIRRILGDTGRFVFFFDADAAGQKAARKTFDMSAPIHANAYVCVAEGGDPCDIREKHGDEELRRQIAPSHHVPLTNFVLKSERENYDISTPEGRTGFLRVTPDILKKITDPVLREEYIRNVAFLSGTTLDVVRNALRGKITSSAPSHAEEPPPMDPYDAAPQVVQNPRSRQQQEALLALMIQYPHQSYRVIKQQGLKEELFDDDLMSLATEIYLMLEGTDGTLHQVQLSEYSDPQFVTELAHKPFPVLDRLTGAKVGESVERMTKTFLRALQDFKRKEASQALRAKVANAFADNVFSNEDYLVKEVIEEDERIKNTYS